jgi:hypothetical protein
VLKAMGVDVKMTGTVDGIVVLLIGWAVLVEVE